MGMIICPYCNKETDPKPHPVDAARDSPYLRCEHCDKRIIITQPKQQEIT